MQNLAVHKPQSLATQTERGGFDDTSLKSCVADSCAFRSVHYLLAYIHT
jgi:hypothetical protein